MDFTDIEDAIKTTIRNSLPYVRTVETYAGQLEGEIGERAAPFPAVFVTYGGSELDFIDGRSMSDAPRFSVIVVTKDVRGGRDLRKGTYGCYRMVRDVLSALTNRRLGLAAMEPMRPVRVSLIFISKTVAAYGVDFRTSYDTSYEGD